MKKVCLLCSLVAVLAFSSVSVGAGTASDMHADQYYESMLTAGPYNSLENPIEYLSKIFPSLYLENGGQFKVIEYDELYSEKD